MTVIESIKALRQEYTDTPRKECTIEEEKGDIVSLFSSSSIDILFNAVSCDSIVMPTKEELMVEVIKKYPEMGKIVEKYDNETFYINKVGNFIYLRITNNDELFYLITGYCKLHQDDEFDYNAFNLIVKKLNRISFAEGVVIGVSEKDLLAIGAEMSKINMILKSHLTAGQIVKIIKE